MPLVESEDGVIISAREEVLVRRAILSASLLCCALAAHGAAPPPGIADDCARLLPRSLLQVIKVEYPGSRLGSTLDYAPEDLAEFRDQGQPCPAVDMADVTGEGRGDYGSCW